MLTFVQFKDAMKKDTFFRITSSGFNMTCVIDDVFDCDYAFHNVISRERFVMTTDLLYQAYKKNELNFFSNFRIIRKSQKKID